jgi:hypothetical protein
MIGGQPVPLPPGAHPEHQMRSIIDAVLAKAKEVGLPGRAQSDSPNEEVIEEPLDPGLMRAQAAIDEGNWDAAISAYQELLKERPTDSLARIGLLNVELFKRLDDVDFDGLYGDIFFTYSDFAVLLLVRLASGSHLCLMPASFLICVLHPFHLRLVVIFVFECVNKKFQTCVVVFFEWKPIAT